MGSHLADTLLDRGYDVHGVDNFATGRDRNLEPLRDAENFSFYESDIRDADTVVDVTQSSLYHWLTKEPDPEVVVTDLRETYTVGLFIAILDRIVGTLAPIYRHSRLKDGLDAIAALSSQAADTRIGGVLVALFEPPEPPADATDAHANTPSRTDAEEDAPDRDTE